MVSSKAEKEAFVSNLKGTTIAEIVLISLLVPACLYLRAVLWSWLRRRFGMDWSAQVTTPVAMCPGLWELLIVFLLMHFGG
eukprot:COSAG01_NODE_30812_length_609_cov_0.915686_1_plen_81_part_00